MPLTPQPTESGPAPRDRRLAPYVAAVFLFWASMYLYVPTLPIYAESKVASLTGVGVVLSMYGLWQGLVRFPLGLISDRLGRRKPFILAGFLLSGLGACLMAAADGPILLGLGRAITGLAAGTWVPLVVSFVSLFPTGQSQRAATLVNLVNSAGMLVAALATGWLNRLGGYALAFYLAAGLALLAFGILMPVGEQATPGKRRSGREIRALVTRRDVLGASILGIVAQYAAWATTFSFVPILAARMGAGEVLQSLLLSANLAVVLLGNLAAAAVVRRAAPSTIVCASFLLLALGLGVAGAARSLPILFMAQFCAGLGAGLGFPVLMGACIRRVPDSERSTAMGLFQTLYAVGMFTGPWLSGYAAVAIGIQPTFVIVAAICLLAGLLGRAWVDSELPSSAASRAHR